MRKEISPEIENCYVVGKHDIFDSVIRNAVPENEKDLQR